MQLHDPQPGPQRTLRRRAHVPAHWPLGCCLWLTITAGAAAQTTGPGIAWSAPPECPARQAANEALVAMVGDALAASGGQSPLATVTITREGAHYRAKIALAGSTKGARELRSDPIEQRHALRGRLPQQRADRQPLTGVQSHPEKSTGLVMDLAHEPAHKLVALAVELVRQTGSHLERGR